MREPLETAEILAFTKTIDAKSLSRAAAELGIPRATLGRRLSRLEERLGVRLLRRTTRSLTVTDAGEALYRSARIVLDAVDQAEASVRRDSTAIRGPVRVSMPPLRDPSFSQMVAEFAKKHPEVSLQLHYSSRFVDLRREGYDVALRASAENTPGLFVRTLHRSRTLAVASPAYLEANGTPKSVRDLKNHRILVGFERGELPQTHWPLLAGGRVQVDSVFACNELLQVFDAALAGLGIAMLPEILVRAHIDEKELVEVLPKVLGTEVRVCIVRPEAEFVPPQVRAFIDAIVAWARESMPGVGKSAKRCR